jgi:hypothetical protein
MEHSFPSTVSDSEYSPKWSLSSRRIRNREDRSNSRECTQSNNIQQENNSCLIVGLQEHLESFNESHKTIIHEFSDKSDHLYLNTYTLHSGNLITSREMKKHLWHVRCWNTTKQSVHLTSCRDMSKQVEKDGTRDSIQLATATFWQDK